MFGRVKTIFNAFMASGDGSFDSFIPDITEFSRFYGINFWSVDWKKERIAKSVFPLCIIFLYSVAFAAYYFINFLDDLDLILHASMFGLQGSLLLVKLAMVVFVHREKILDLFDVIRRDFWNIGEGEWLKKKILLDGSRRMRLLIRIIFMSYLTAITLYISAPVYAIVVYSRFDSPLKLPLPGKNQKQFSLSFHLQKS